MVNEACVFIKNNTFSLQCVHCLNATAYIYIYIYIYIEQDILIFNHSD